MLVCRHCGWENPDEAAFCTNCGRPLVRQRTVDRRPIEDDSDDDVMRPKPQQPSLPKLKAPPDPGRMAPTLLDFRMPSDMLAELSKLKPTSDARPADGLQAHSAGTPEPAEAGAPTVDEQPPVAVGVSEPVIPAAVTSPAGDAPEAPLAEAVEPSEPAALAEPDLAGTTELPIPPAVRPAAGSEPSEPDEAPQADGGPPQGTPADGAPPIQAGPSTIVELPPVMLVTEPPVPSPPPVPVEPEAEQAGAAPPLGASEAPIAESTPIEPPEQADADAPLPPPEPDEGDDVVLLGEPVVEPDPFLVEADGGPVDADPADSSTPPAAGPPGDEPDGPASAEEPLPGTDRIVPAEEIAIRSRPPQPAGADEPGDLARTMRSVALSDIAKALRAEATAADRADEAAASAPPPAAAPEAAIDESIDGFEGVDPAQLAVDEPVGADGDADELTGDEDDDAFHDIVDPNLDDEPSVDGVTPAVEPDLELIEDASMPPPRAAAVELIAEALESDAPGPMLSTDELEELRPGGPPPVPVPSATARLVLRVMNREVGDDVVVEVGRAPVVIGSGNVELSVEDAWLSPRHARVSARDGRLEVEDLESLNGVWIRTRSGVHLEVGDRFIIGRQLCEIASDAGARQPHVVDGVRRLGSGASGSDLQLRILATDGRVSRSVRLTQDALRLGRHLGEVVFTDDNHLSATHAVIRADGAQVRLDDLGSRNGTWVRVRGPRSLDPGDSFLTGRTVWRVGTAVR